MKRFNCIFLFLYIFTIPFHSYSQPAKSKSIRVEHFKTENGVEFGVWGFEENVKHKPLIFLLSNTIDGTLGNEYFRQSGNELCDQYGWLCASIDLPYHGREIIEGEPEELQGWALAVEKGNDFVTKNNDRVKDVIDFLIKRGYVDSSRILISGISRGGYLALQYAAFDPRIKVVTLFSPVITLFSLREFNGIKQKGISGIYNLQNYINVLSQKKIFLAIGDRDYRVGTDMSVEFAREISNSSSFNKSTGSLELIIKSEPKGHHIPDGMVDLATQWILSTNKNYSNITKYEK